MPEYTFDNLSPLDFELLVRDLLQEELDIRFESFCSGKDEGIDLRHAKSESHDIIVQCKHYANTSWDGLLRSYRNEQVKVETLKPERYIAATSQRLNPSRKQAIMDAVTPFCAGTEDVLGREDLNNLLARHPSVEKTHFKLWLASVPVLQKVLHANIFSEQSSLLESLRRHISRYVMNPSFGRAKGMLSEQGFCMITGSPGMGKTTLAEMLVLDHVDQGFECFRLWETVAEARDVLSPSEPQLFYFDDFLGRTGLRAAPHKNEDTRLLSFISDVAQSKNTRFIITTREYILNQARSFMEALASSTLDSARCVVCMADHTLRIRAEILYNHLYYSALPREYVDSIVLTEVYRSIIKHKNYNPRIVDVMTHSLSTRDITPEEYPAAFLSNLEQPYQIWETAFQAHLDSASRNLLLTLCSLPDRVFIDDLGEAFAAFHRFRREKYGQSGTAYDFSKALKELEGSFTRTSSYPSSIIVEFHNPSVRDFLESWLERHPTDLEDLALTGVFNEQIERLWDIARSWKDQIPLLKLIETLAERYVVSFKAESCNIRARLDEASAIVDWWKKTRFSHIGRFNRLIRLIQGTDQALAESTVQRLLPIITEVLNAAYVRDRDQICDLLGSILTDKLPSISSESPLFEKALDTAFQDGDLYGLDVDEFSALADLLMQFPDIVGEDVVERLNGAFESTCEDDLETLRDEGDSDDRESWYSEWESVASSLGLWMPMDEDEYVGNDVEEPWKTRPSRVEQGQKVDHISDGELDSMFRSLLESDSDS